MFAPLAMGLAIFVIVGTLIEVVMRAWRPGLAPGAALKRARGLPLSFFGGALAHLGLGVTLLGLSASASAPRRSRPCTRARPLDVGPYTVTLNAIGERLGPNYKEAVASVTVRSGGAVVAEIAPARRQFASREMTTTQAGIATLHFGQVYVSIGDPAPDGAVPARLYWKPLVTLIWFGAAAMALGGGLSLADRRLRFGAAFGRRPARACARNRRNRPMRLIRLALVVLLALASAPAFAVQPDEVMKDPALEARARALSAELRCLVCQNQSIDDSEAPLARDIRLLIRQRIEQGESNDEVRAYLVSRYGDFILLKPPFQADTLLLWLSPAIVLSLGAAAALYALRRAPRATPGLTAEEEARLAALTKGDASRG